MIESTLAVATDPVPLAIVDSLVEFLHPSELAGVLVDGLSKAAIYAMIAGGLTLIFGLMGVLNFAHGSLTMVGAYLGGAVMVLTVSTTTGPLTRLAFFFVAVVVVFGALSAVGGALEVTLIRRLYDRPPIAQILLTFGLTLIVDELMRIILEFYDIQPRADWIAAWGTKPWFLSQRLSIGPVNVRGLALFEIVMGALTVGGIWLFLTRTRYGLFIRAGSEDSEMASALGIDVRRVFSVVFALGTGVAGVAGALLMWDTLWGASVPLGAETLLPAFVVVIIGGLGTFRGTVAAALLVGLIDAIMTWWFVNEIEFSGLPQLTIFMILVLVLIVRPQGLFGVEGVGGH
jgi:branched-chain amino acid transport system permease protein